jgi:hypothetical protein
LQQALAAAGLADAITVVAQSTAHVALTTASVAPGQSIRHYSPHVPSYRLAGQAWERRRALQPAAATTVYHDQPAFCSRQTVQNIAFDLFRLKELFVNCTVVPKAHQEIQRQLILRTIKKGTQVKESCDVAQIWRSPMKVVINAYRVRGHQLAKGHSTALVREVCLHENGLSEADLDTVFQTPSLEGIDQAPLKDIIAHLEKCYCGSNMATFLTYSYVLHCSCFVEMN